MASDISSAKSMTNATLSAAQSQMSAAKVAAAAKAASGEDVKKTSDRINKTSQDFEAVFVTEMLKPMFDMVKVDPEFGGGKGEEVFRDFTLNEYGKKIASEGGFGLASHVREQLIRLQAAKDHPGATPVQLASDIKNLKDAMKKIPSSKINSLN